MSHEIKIISVPMSYEGVLMMLEIAQSERDNWRSVAQQVADGADAALAMQAAELARLREAYSIVLKQRDALISRELRRQERERDR